MIMKKSSKNRILAAVCIIADIAISIYQTINVLNAYASKNWPTTTGAVLSSELTGGTGGTGSARSNDYKPNLRCTYTTRAAEPNFYEADRISFSDGITKTREHTQQIADQYPPGKTVTVHDDPDHPEIAVVEPGVSPARFIYLVLGLAHLAIGAYTAFNGAKK